MDKASEGLLLLTNDSEWGARIAAPETHLDKTYHVQLGIVADEEFIQALVRGVKTKDGEVLRAKQARRLRSGQKNCWLEIVLDEGKNRHIRRMIEAMGVEVLRLVRVAIGPLQLGDLAKGEHRSLTSRRKADARRLSDARSLMSDLTFLSAVSMAEQIRKKKISPVELIDAHLKQIEKLNPKLNAFVHVEAEHALRAAELLRPK